GFGRASRRVGWRGVSKAQCINHTLEPALRVVVPLQAAPRVVPDVREPTRLVVAAPQGLLEAGAVPALLDQPAFGVVGVGVQHAQGGGAPLQATVLVPGLAPVGAGRSGVFAFDRAAERVMADLLFAW